MSGEADEQTAIYYCVVCGPCLQLLCIDGDVTVHNKVPHPFTMTFDEEESPQ